MSTTYTTKQGDMWDSIALAQYGDARYVDALMMANTGHIGAYIFSEGVELVIPEVDTDSTAYSANLPPWKQVI